jgi:hypothetical protein
MIALVTLAQFGLSWWRAMVAQVAEHPLTARGRSLTEQWKTSDGGDFHALLSLHESCPLAPSNAMGLIRLYYRTLEGMRNLAARFSPSLEQWARSEMQVCYRYAAVRIDERLTRMHALMAEMRTF